jgi:TPR repeat protein
MIKMKYLYKLVLILCFIPLVLACSTLNLKEGINSFRAQDYRKAFIRLKPEAEKGQADAQYAVGYMYYYGQGVLEDRKKAWYWISQAAKLGQRDAITAVHILQEGSLKKQKIFESGKLEHFPVQQEMY